MSKDVQEKDYVSKVTIYKLRDDFLPDVVLTDYVNNKNGSINGWNYKIYTRSKPGQRPSWRPLVAGLLDESEIPTNAYASLVFLFEKERHVFALTSGYGYADVRNYGIKDYGIEIACKSLDPNELNHLYQKQPTGNVFGLSRSLRGKYLPANDIINQRSVLKALRGKVINHDLGVTMEGRTSLAISGKKKLEDVLNLLDGIILLEQSDKFTVIIKGLEECGKDLRVDLDNELVNTINSGKFDDILFGYDDDLIYTNCERIRVGREDTEYSYEDTQGVLASSLRQKAKDPSSVAVVGLDENDQIIFRKKLIDLIEGELDFRGEKYFRIDRKWYKTNSDYKKKVDDDFRNIEIMQSDYFMPWGKNGSSFVGEDDFLKENINADRVLTHTQKISQVELADIFDKKNRYLVHVKKGKGAFLRNLFAQGYVSSSLLNGDDTFKKEAKDKFGVEVDEKMTIIFAVFPEGESNLDSIFTLFAKVDLLERYDSLKNMGFEVKYCLIRESL